jgi:hypothetical protein
MPPRNESEEGADPERSLNRDGDAFRGLDDHEAMTVKRHLDGFAGAAAGQRAS